MDKLTEYMEQGQIAILHVRIEIRRAFASETVRADWAEAAKSLSERGEDRLVDKPASTRFDDKEWEWQ